MYIRSDNIGKISQIGQDKVRWAKVRFDRIDR